jgi:hypothetical protein
MANATHRQIRRVGWCVCMCMDVGMGMGIGIGIGIGIGVDSGSARIPANRTHA